MKIRSLDEDRVVQHVAVELTEVEAAELRDALELLLEDSAGRHEHVPSADFQAEITVWIRRT